MLKKEILKTLILTMMIAFCLLFKLPAYAEKKCNEAIVVPTPTGNANYDNINPLKFHPNNPDEIECGSGVTIAVTGGKSPLTWDVSGNGYSLDETEDERIYVLSCTGST